jgi:predicted porin
MNKNIKLAVAGAVLALSATAANAGIVIPAGDWTLDVSGNVNMYTSWAKTKGTNPIVGGLTGNVKADGSATDADNKTVNSFGNGLLPNFLSVGGSTRQNDLDVSFVISIQPGSANNAALQQVGSASNTQGGLNNRQAFITFGDKSWGSVKLGKDLGIFASDAILSDITLLGVGGGFAGSAGNTSLGRIGSGYIYADWKPQIAYTTPNFSGFQATVGIAQAFKATGWKDNEVGSYTATDGYLNAVTSSTTNASPAYEGKASYSFNANGVDGKVWVSGIAQRIGSFGAYKNDDSVAYAGDIGAKVAVSGFEAVGYYYTGTGVGTTGQFLNGYGASTTAGTLKGRDSDGGYVQLAYALPTKTKIAASWGVSNLDKSSSGDLTNLVDSNEQWNAMVIHPLTKHLNLVAEYSHQKTEAHDNTKNTANVGSVGGILFF